MSSSSAAAAHKTAADRFYQSQNFNKAIEEYTHAIESENDDIPLLATLYSNRSATYLKLGQAQKAIDDAKSCTQIRPTWVKGYSRLGAAYFRLGKRTEATRAYEKAIELDPQNAELQRSLAQVEGRGGGVGAGGNGFPGGLGSLFQGLGGLFPPGVGSSLPSSLQQAGTTLKVGLRLTLSLRC